MKNINKTFRDNLIDQETPNLTLKQQYERKVQEMIEKKLTLPMKIGHILGLCLGLFFLITFGTIAIILPKELPPFVRFGFGLGALFGLLFVIMEIMILKKGSFNVIKDEMAFAGVSWGFIIIMSTFILVFGDQFPDPTRSLVSMLFFLIPAAAFLLRALILGSEARTQEKLLEIEYRIAELTETIEKSKK